MSRFVKFQSNFLRKIAVNQKMNASGTTTLFKDSKMYKSMLNNMKLVKIDIAIRASVVSLSALATELLSNADTFVLPDMISGYGSDDEDGG